MTIIDVGHIINLIQNNGIANVQCNWQFRFFQALNISHTSKTVPTENLDIAESYNIGF